jgi:hypothetical protein
LTVPDPDELRVHMQQSEQFTSIELEWVEDALQRATDLMQIATGLTEDPTDELDLRFMVVGILAQAHAIFVTGGEDREALYSPFSSERIGSYSYSKAMQAVRLGQDTGIPEFDNAVAHLRVSTDTVGPFAISSEQVFSQPYSEEDVTRIGRDPVLRPGAWNDVW